MDKLEKKIDSFLKARGWDGLRPSDLAKSIMIEGAELLELFQWENLPLEEVKSDKAKIEEIKKELADVFIYAIQMSVLLGLNTEKIILAKLRRVEKKYPAALLRQKAKRESGSGQDSEYWKIKRRHRKNKK